MSTLRVRTFAVGVGCICSVRRTHASNRFFARALIASLLGFAGMSLGCNKSPAGPTPPSAQTVTAASPNTVFTVTAISPAAGLIGEEAWITGTGFLRGATVTLDGVAAFVRNVNPSGTVIVAALPVHAAGRVDVVVTNPGGQSGTLAGGYTFVPAEVFSLVSMSASPSLVTSGGQLKMSWVGPGGRGCNGGGDWISLFKVGDSDITGSANGHSDLWFVHLCGATSGTSTLNAPPQAGQYEFRYMVGAASVARSSPVTVSASASPAP